MTNSENPNPLIFASSLAELSEQLSIYEILDKRGLNPKIIFIKDVVEFRDIANIGSKVNHISPCNLRLYLTSSIGGDLVKYSEHQKTSGDELTSKTTSSIGMPLSLRLYLWAQKKYHEIKHIKPIFFLAQIIGPVITFTALLFKYIRTRSVIKKLIKSSNTNVIILPECGVGPVLPNIINEAKKRKIKVLIFPFTICNQNEAIQSLKAEPAFQYRPSFLLSFLFRNWRYKKDHIDILRLPKNHVLCHYFLGITPPDPWHYLSSNYGKICVDSAASLEYFKKSGIKNSSMKVVGSALQDAMLQKKRALLIEKNLLKNADTSHDFKRVLLVSGCPNQLAASVPFCEFNSMENLAVYLSNALLPLTEHFDILLTPHPNFPEFGDMVSHDVFKISQKPTFEILPTSDLYLAFASATIRWSLFCGIPTINYDIFNYKYEDFQKAKAVIEVNNSSQFESIVSRLKLDFNFLDALKEDAHTHSHFWGLQDGKNAARIIEEVCR